MIEELKKKILARVREHIGSIREKIKTDIQKLTGNSQLEKIITKNRLKEITVKRIRLFWRNTIWLLLMNFKIIYRNNCHY